MRETERSYWCFALDMSGYRLDKKAVFTDEAAAVMQAIQYLESSAENHRNSLEQCEMRLSEYRSRLVIQEDEAESASSSKPTTTPESHWDEFVKAKKEEIESRAVKAYRRRFGGNAPDPTWGSTQVCKVEGYVRVEIGDGTSELAAYRVTPNSDGSFRLNLIGSSLTRRQSILPTIGLAAIEDEPKSK